MEETPNAKAQSLAVTSIITISILLGLTLVAAVIALIFRPPTTITIEPSPTPVLSRESLPDPANYAWVEVETGFDNPLFITHAGDGTHRLFGIEQLGYVWIVENGETLPDPFLDISRLLPTDVFRGAYTERGLLGFAFDPEYHDNGLMYVHYSNRDGDTTIARYHVSKDDPNQFDPDSGQIILTIDDPYRDHNGGMIAFGPDGYLYIGIGDGGNVDVPNEFAQDPQRLLGKILRIDVHADTYTIPPDNPFVNDPDFLPEIWAYGLRNPWRFSFDRATGDLYIGDVGQWDYEEINFAPADDPGGHNYGWSFYEGDHETDNGTDFTGDTMTPPIFEYPHSEGCSVTGGYVYRGQALPELSGVYFFGDYCLGRIWVSYRDSSGAWQTQRYMDMPGKMIVSFGEDEAGELYLVDHKGTVYRLQAPPPELEITQTPS